MTRPAIALRALAAPLLLLAATICAQAQDADPASPLQARLDGIVEAFMLRERAPGAIAALVDGDEVILRGYGLADVEAGTPVGPDDTRPG